MPHHKLVGLSLLTPSLLRSKAVCSKSWGMSSCLYSELASEFMILFLCFSPSSCALTHLDLWTVSHLYLQRGKLGWANSRVYTLVSFAQDKSLPNILDSSSLLINNSNRIQTPSVLSEDGILCVKCLEDYQTRYYCSFPAYITIWSSVFSFISSDLSGFRFTDSRKQNLLLGVNIYRVRQKDSPRF